MGLTPRSKTPPPKNLKELKGQPMMTLRKSKSKRQRMVPPTERLLRSMPQKMAMTWRERRILMKRMKRIWERRKRAKKEKKISMRQKAKRERVKRMKMVKARRRKRETIKLFSANYQHQITTLQKRQDQSSTQSSKNMSVKTNKPTFSIQKFHVFSATLSFSEKKRRLLIERRSLSFT